MTSPQPNSSTPSLSRRSTHACHRCRTKKLKCSVHSSSSKCLACAKARQDCFFDHGPNRSRNSTDPIAALEARVDALQNELRRVNPSSHALRDGATPSSQTGDSISPGEDHLERSEGLRASNPTGLTESEVISSQTKSTKSTTVFDSLFSEFITNTLPAGRLRSTGQEPTSRINIMQSGTSGSEAPINNLPLLPVSAFAERLFERAYLYTQARYCLVDWIQVRKWHQDRTRICYSTADDDIDSQRGAYFIWIVYAIGAGLISNPEYPSKAYFARAQHYLPAVLATKDLVAVQGLLCLLQYVFRVTGGPSVWHIVGITLRLCIELDCHRSVSRANVSATPFMKELRKRLFWCTYCFDRLTSSITRRPFGISDMDIDVEVPVNIDIFCDDDDVIREKQALQGIDDDIGGYNSITSMTASLHHLQMYRLRSRILTQFAGPHTLAPTYNDTTAFFQEIDVWKERAPTAYPTQIPHQPQEHVLAMYFHTVLLIMRPVLSQPHVHPEILQRCAKDSAGACENSRSLNLNPQTAPNLVNLYQTFSCGIALLLCHAIEPGTLGMKRLTRAIIACSNTLAMHTRMYEAVAPFRELFEKLSDIFLGNLDTTANQNTAYMNRFRSFLREVLSSNPADIPSLLRAYTTEEEQVTEALSSKDPVLASETMPLDFVSFSDMCELATPFEAAIDLFPYFTFSNDFQDFDMGE